MIIYQIILIIFFHNFPNHRCKNSKESFFFLTISPGFDDYISFELLLEIVNVKNSTNGARWYNTDYVGLGDENQMGHIILFLETEPLPGGTYQINTYYRCSHEPGGGINRLFLAQGQLDNFTRSLLAQELKVN